MKNRLLPILSGYLYFAHVLTLYFFIKSFIILVKKLLGVGMLKISGGTYMKMLAIVLAAIMCLSLAGFSETVLLSDFSKGEASTSLGGVWFSVNDAANQGDSIVTPNPFALTKSDKGGVKSDYYARITGSVTTKFQYGFVALDCDFISNQSSLDLNKFKGVKFYTRGDGKSYKLQIRSSANPDYCYYTSVFQTTNSWVEITIPFSAFRQESWGKHTDLKDSLAGAIGFQYITINQPIKSIDLELDEVYLY